MKRLLGALTFVGLSAVASGAFAQEIQIRGPLAGAASCRHCVEYRTFRLTVAPTFGVSLVDEFDRALFFGLDLKFHVTDGIAFGVWGAYAGVHVPTGLATGVANALTPAEGSPQRTDPALPRSNATPNIPRGENFSSQVGQIDWILSAPQITVVPLRGKLALFQNLFLDTDFYLFAGLGIVGLRERANFDGWSGGTRPLLSGNEAELRANQTERVSRVAFTGTFGVGINFYLAKFLSLSVEYRAYPFNWNTSGTDENTLAQSCGADGTASCAGFPDYQVSEDNMGAGGRFVIDENDRAFHWNQMINFGITIYLPPSPRISP